MAVYLLDTTIFSFLMSQHPRLRAQVASLTSTDRLIICSIVRGEIRYGLERMASGRRREALETRAAYLFAAVPCEPIPEAAGDHYGKLKSELENQGIPLDENDLWIAATALAIGAVVVTSDSDFQRVTGLVVEDWTK